MVTAVVHGTYYRQVCHSCLGNVELSSNAIGYDRRRQYEDYAQDTVQPYNANGPSLEFLRLYPEQAQKIFKPEEIEEMKRKL